MDTPERPNLAKVRSTFCLISSAPLLRKVVTQATFFPLFAGDKRPIVLSFAKIKEIEVDLPEPAVANNSVRPSERIIGSNSSKL